MSKEKKLHIVFVLDETSSMDVVRDATISGFNEYLDSIRQSDKGNTRFTLMKFHSQKMEYVYTRARLDKIIGLSRDTYTPAHITPLFDAIGKAVDDHREFLKTKKNKHETMLAIMTDGDENSSKEYKTKAQVSDLIAQCEKDGWTFLFLGANIDSFAEAKSLGIDTGSVIHFDSSVPKGAFKAASYATSRYMVNDGVQMRASVRGYVPDDEDNVQIVSTDNS